MVSFIFDLDLRGSCVAFTCYNNEDNESYLVVVNWEQANGNPSYPFRMIATKRTFMSTKVYLLPESRLVLKQSRFFSLHDYSVIQETTEFVKDDQDMQNSLLWEYDSQFHGLPHLKVFCSGNIAKIIFSGCDSLYAIDIREPPNGTPQNTELVAFPKGFLGSTYLLGFTHAVYHTFPDRTFMLLSYGFSDSEESSFLIRRMPPDMPEAFYPSLSSIDSETARLVLYSKLSKLGYIVDYVLTMS